MTVAVVERDTITELAETEEITKSRELYQRWNEMRFTNDGIDSLVDALLGSCDRKLYIGQEAVVYYDILDTRDFLKEKYALLSEAETAKFEGDVEEALDEADKVLSYIRDSIDK